MITMDTVVAVGPDQVSVDLESESVILHAPSGTYFGLDEVGKRIWQLLQSPIATRRIHETLLAEFDVEPEQCRTDLLTFLSQLESEGLLRVDRDAPTA